MHKDFIRDSFLYGISNIILLLLSLLTVPFYTRILSPSDYGIIEILNIGIIFVNLVIPLEISQGLARYLPEAKNIEEKIAYSSTSLLFTTSIYSIFTLILFIKSNMLSQWITGSQTYKDVVRVAILTMWGNGIFYLIQNQLRWGLKSKYYAMTSIIFSVVSIIISVFLVLGLKIGVIGIFYGQLIGCIVGSVVGLYLNRKSYQLKFDWNKFTEMLKFSLPLVPSSIGVFFTQYFDRIATKNLLSISELGLLGIGYRISSLVGLIIAGFQSALLPLVYANYYKPDVQYELEKIFRFFIAISLLIFLIITLFIQEFLVILVGRQFYSASLVVPFLIFAVLLSGMYIFAPGLNLAKKTHIISVINIGGAALNIILNLKLIRYLGIRGAAISALISAFCVFFAYMFFSQKWYYVPHRWNSIIKGIVISIAVIIIGIQINVSFLFNIAAKMILIFIAIITFFYIGLLQKKDFQWLAMNLYTFFKDCLRN